MPTIYSAGGQPYRRSGTSLYGADGHYVGRFKGDKVYDTGGRYLGEIRNSRLVRSRTHVGVAGASAAKAGGVGTPAARRVASAPPVGCDDFTA